MSTYQRRVLSAPEPGWFSMRLVKGGPLVPARLFRGAAVDPETGQPLDRSPVLLAQIGDRVPSSDPGDIERVWLQHPIPEAEYHHLMRVLAWAKARAPDAPEAKPRRPINHGKLPPVF